MREISDVFNLPRDVIKNYVQFGEVFNLLHAGASYLRVHQKGFGAVGVSKKYGTRALKRYPIFWGISNIGSLPNPDPADMGEWDGKLPDPKTISLDTEAEAARGALRLQAQEWAGLEQNANAELFVFVGRWSEQKGVDLVSTYCGMDDLTTYLVLTCSNRSPMCSPRFSTKTQPSSSSASGL